MSDIKVLCVENHPEYMGALKYMLEKSGYEVTLAATGDQALRLLTTLHVWTAFSWNMTYPMRLPVRYGGR